MRRTLGVVGVLASLVCLPRLAAAQVSGSDVQLEQALNQIDVSARAILGSSGDMAAVQQEAAVIQANVEMLPPLVVGQTQAALDLVVRMGEDAAALTHYATNEDSFEIARWAAQLGDDVGYLRDELALGP